MTRIGLVLLVALVLLAIVGPWIAPDPLAMHGVPTGMPAPPSSLHWLGTDQYTRDLFARLAVGARHSLLIGGIAVAGAAAIGLLLGILAGRSDSLAARGIQRLIDLALALPRIVVLLVVLAATGPLSAPLLGVLLALTGWPMLARLVQGETIRLRQTPWLLSAEALGAAPGRILLRELLPATLPPVLVASSLGLADAILLEASLSFLGLGVRPPLPSWGGMILDASGFLATAPWLLLPPTVALGLATTAATLLGDGLRRSLQPGAS